MGTFFDKPVEFVKISSITMTRDALLVIISGCVLSTSLIINYGIKPFYLLILIGYLMSAYRINCMEVGSCTTYARIISIMTFISVIYVILNLNAPNQLGIQRLAYLSK
jgi:hypothetical protein